MHATVFIGGNLVNSGGKACWRLLDGVCVGLHRGSDVTLVSLI